MGKGEEEKKIYMVKKKRKKEKAKGLRRTKKMVRKIKKINQKKIYICQRMNSNNGKDFEEMR